MTVPLPKDTAILIVAPNASTRFGGEAVLPVHYFRILRARGYAVTLMAHARNRADLEAQFGAEAPDIEYIPDTLWHRILWRLGKPFPHQIRQFVFGSALAFVSERLQARRIRALVRAGKADLIHQPAPVSPRRPSAVHGFGTPVVIGPMNGGMTYPPGYADFESPAERAFVPLARAVSGLANRLIPGKARAAVLLVANARTRAALPVTHPNVVELVENGVDLSTFQTPAARAGAPAGALRLVFMGRLVDWKATDVTLQALARARAQGVAAELDILGDGAERAKLEAQAAQLGLSEAVRFHGFLPQADCAGFLDRADALILNSIYECGGAVVLEAMSAGLPVIGPDWGGPADYINAQTGILVAPAPRDGYAERLAEAILRLARDPDLRAAMGAAGAARIRAEFDWDRKVDRMLEIYASVLPR